MYGHPLVKNRGSIGKEYQRKQFYNQFRFCLGFALVSAIGILLAVGCVYSLVMFGELLP